MANQIVKAFMTIETGNPEELQRMLDHHMEYLIDFDEHYDTVKSISNVMSYDAAERHDRTKLQILSAVINDILSDEPSDADLDHDDDAISLYGGIHNLKESLARMGMD